LNNDFLPFYAILRAIPSKLGGVSAMLGALVILLPLSFFNTYQLRSTRYRPLLNKLFWIFTFNFFLLLWVGAKPISQPYLLIGQISTLIYFAYYLLLMIMGYPLGSMRSAAQMISYSVNLSLIILAVIFVHGSIY
jgi:quinol-cytochrome oxidoreductase complex cytochrome b subunit